MKTFIQIKSKNNEYNICTDDITSIDAIEASNGEIIHSVTFKDTKNSMQISKGQYLQLLANSKVI